MDEEERALSTRMKEEYVESGTREVRAPFPNCHSPDAHPSQRRFKQRHITPCHWRIVASIQEPTPVPG